MEGVRADGRSREDTGEELDAFRYGHALRNVREKRNSKLLGRSHRIVFRFYLQQWRERPGSVLLLHTYIITKALLFPYINLC